MDISVNSLDNVVDRVMAMRRQEEGPYLYESYLLENEDAQVNVSWREKITHWSYNVVDHFGLSREVVAISLNLFDRFLATRGNTCNGNMALLTSLSTLHLAIKLHDTKKIRISTLASLSRGQFGPKHIEEMEWVILNALQWKLHPPTAYSFIFYFLLFLPKEASSLVQREIFELSRYFTELAMCDSVLVKTKASTIAFASVLNVIQDIGYKSLSAGLKEKFLRDTMDKVNLDFQASDVVETRGRIAKICASNQQDGSFKTTIADEALSMASYGSNGSLTRSVDSDCFRRVRSNSLESLGSKGSYNRYSASPRGRRVMAASPIGGRARISTSHMLA
mmetsp:Transcript_20091/g.29816  ORF Transcript_20091/g.29816 Transcript_20091/m.29816 type:complete len:335 (+) Transcript_20091:331-1335(+)|eukprot:CAMPEP_0194220184 /NCGR_PEP_ID=MMETSP0156-20130528/27682_1 /TAXON_ID=33649 /ORGANISM="Thalassionema nitzschioides, Strain L26-B" /LENGTH=334 /DNA_ID=CAMNT_0038950117 /DNA_START=308 /DNA_END=1312 /DNA_ORIENTATION=-